METMNRLRRSTRSLVRRDWPLRPLTESELELLRFVAEQPGSRVGEAAATLGLAQNTVSTLVGRLVELGLLDRRTDDRDTRAAALALTPAATQRMAAWRDRRRQVTAKSLAALDAGDLRAIEAALPALRRLVDALEAR
jgi:DNA-binding MarR family transcriptional regulator